MMRQNNKVSCVARTIYGIVLTLGMVLYTYVSHTSSAIVISRVAGLYLSLFGVISFLYVFKRDNLFCFETIFLPIYFLSAFFPELVLNNISESVNAFYSYTMSQLSENKSVILQTIGLYGYLWSNACVLTKKVKVRETFKDFKVLGEQINFHRGVRIVCIIILIYVLYLSVTGVISSWFHYSNSYVGYSNLAIVYLTIFFLTSTSLEFSRLSQMQVDGFKMFYKKVNKLYLVLLGMISSILLISGNRNECLLILLPPVIAYSTVIKRISNKLFIVLLVVGISFMILIGLVRQTGVMGGYSDPIGLFESTRDFGVVSLNTSYLIEYTDKNGPIYLQNCFMFLMSSVPLLGSLCEFLGFTFATRTVDLTTLGLQSVDNMDSGFGTALIGDIYYSGVGFGVFLYMVLFGYIMSSLYIRFNRSRKFNIWLFNIYLFMFANAVYCVRAEWTMPFRYIGFSFFLLLAILPFINKMKQAKR